MHLLESSLTIGRRRGLGVSFALIPMAESEPYHSPTAMGLFRLNGNVRQSYGPRRKRIGFSWQQACSGLWGMAEETPIFMASSRDLRGSVDRWRLGAPSVSPIDKFRDENEGDCESELGEAMGDVPVGVTRSCPQLESCELVLSIGHRIPRGTSLVTEPSPGLRFLTQMTSSIPRSAHASNIHLAFRYLG